MSTTLKLALQMAKWRVTQIELGPGHKTHGALEIAKAVVAEIEQAIVLIDDAHGKRAEYAHAYHLELCKLIPAVVDTDEGASIAVKMADALLAELAK